MVPCPTYYAQVERALRGTSSKDNTLKEAHVKQPRKYIGGHKGLNRIMAFRHSALQSLFTPI